MNPITVTPADCSRNPLATADAAGLARRARFSAAIAAGLLLATLAGRAAGANEVWRLDNLKRIGAYPVTVVGAPRVVAVPGGRAMAFDGVRDGIFVPAIPIAQAKAFTIEVLFSPATDGPEAQRFMHFQDTVGRRGTMEIRNNGRGQWWLDTFLRTDLAPAGKGVTLIDPERVHPTGRWYWVALRYDGKTMADFVNGRKELEQVHTFEVIGDGTTSLGVRQNLVYWFKGAIREVRFHREALPEDKLQRVE